MANTAEFGRRAAFAFRRIQQRKHPARYTQADLAAGVSARTGKSFTPMAATGWLGGSVPRELEAMDALAVELDCDFGWLYTGRGTGPAGWEEAAPAPRLPYTKAVSRTEKPATKKSGRKKKGGG